MNQIATQVAPNRINWIWTNLSDDTLLKIDKPPAPKMKFIKPTKKTVGRVMDLTGRRKDIVTGTDWGSVPGEFAGASIGASPFSIFRGDRAQFSVPVDQPFEDPPKSYKTLVRGIPRWLEKDKIYYYLLIHLAKYQLLMISGVDLVDDKEATTLAAWIVIDGTEEAIQTIEKADCKLEFPAREVFQVPKEVSLYEDTIRLTAYQND